MRAPSKLTPSEPGTLAVGVPMLLETVGRPLASNRVNSLNSGNCNTKFLRIRSFCHGSRPVCCRSAATAFRILTLPVTYSSICSAARVATFRFPCTTVCWAPLRSERIDTAPYASSGTTAAAAMSTANRVVIFFIVTRLHAPGATRSTATACKSGLRDPSRCPVSLRNHGGWRASAVATPETAPGGR